MESIIKIIACIFFTGIMFFISCKKEVSCEGCAEKNKPPIAVAGPDQVISLPADSISLDGNNSSDPDGTISVWLWTKISGPVSFIITRASDSSTKVKNLVVGVYQFGLKVTDKSGLSASDTVQISVNDRSQPNRPPAASVGADQTITLPTNIVTLNGNGSTDPDNNITSYLWTKISGPTSFNIVNSNIVQTQVTNLVQGIYQFELKVTDAGGLFSKDTMKVTVTAAPSGLPPCYVENPPVIQATLTQIGTLSVPRMPIAATAGNKVVFAGGWSGVNCGSLVPSSTSSAVDIYDIQANSWSNAQLSIARAGIRSATLGNKIFFAGGENGVSTAYDNVDIYDISNNTWTTEHLSSPRAYVATATIGSKVFFAGGYYYVGTSSLGPNSASNVVDIYDVSTNQWSVATLSATPTALYIATAVNGKVYFAGGNNDGIISIYDNATNTWSTSNLQFSWQPTAYPFFQNPIASFAVGDNIYWVGNVDEGYNPANDDDVYTGRTEVRNTMNNSSSISCSPLVFSQQPVTRNNEIAFFESYSQTHWINWGIKGDFPIYNTITGNWSRREPDFSFITMGHDAGIVSANNTIYVGGGSYNTGPGSCVVLTDKVYILSW